jgi:hypothetical protein
MSAFEWMASALIGAVKPQRFIFDAQGKKTSRTEIIRQFLRSASRPMTAQEVVWAVEFPDFGVDSVWLLMKYDIKKGRVILKNGRYSWSHSYETAEAAAIRDAKKLLERHGYVVQDPKIA